MSIICVHSARLPISDHNRSGWHAFRFPIITGSICQDAMMDSRSARSFSGPDSANTTRLSVYWIWRLLVYSLSISSLFISSWLANDLLIESLGLVILSMSSSF